MRATVKTIKLPDAPAPTKAVHEDLPKRPFEHTLQDPEMLRKDSNRGHGERKPWTDEEKAELIRLREKGLSFNIIADELERTKASVTRMIFRLRDTGELHDEEIVLRGGRGRRGR